MNKRGHVKAQVRAFYPRGVLNKINTASKAYICILILLHMNIEEDECQIRSEASVAYYTMYQSMFCVQAKGQPCLYASNV